MIIQGQVNTAVSPTRETGEPVVQQMQLGELGVSEVLPRYAGLAWSGLVFYGCHQVTPQALSINSSTFTGLAVGNPAGSGKNLVIIDVEISQAAVGAAAVMLPRLGYATITALTTSYSSGPSGVSTIAGSGKNSIATVGSTATLLAAPTIIRPIMGQQWITGGTGMWSFYVKDTVDGAIVIPPGQILTIDSLVAAVTVLASVTWAELPV